jgi:hypothetical protein
MDLGETGSIEVVQDRVLEKTSAEHDNEPSDFITKNIFLHRTDCAMELLYINPLC